MEILTSRYMVWVYRAFAVLFLMAGMYPLFTDGIQVLLWGMGPGAFVDALGFSSMLAISGSAEAYRQRVWPGIALRRRNRIGRLNVPPSYYDPYEVRRYIMQRNGVDEV